MFYFVFSSNPVAAEVFPLAGLAVEPMPDGVEVVGGGIDQLRLVGEDAGLEVAVAFAFHADAGTGEVGGADIGHRAVENHYLEMHPWAESPFQTAPQPRILVEILAEVLTRFFGMKQTHVDTTSQQLIEHRQEWHHIPTTLHIQVLQVGCPNPQIVHDLLATREDLDVMVFVGDVSYHNTLVAGQLRFIQLRPALVE